MTLAGVSWFGADTLLPVSVCVCVCCLVPCRYFLFLSITVELPLVHWRVVTEQFVCWGGLCVCVRCLCVCVCVCVEGHGCGVGRRVWCVGLRITDRC